MENFKKPCKRLLWWMDFNHVCRLELETYLQNSTKTFKKMHIGLSPLRVCECEVEDDDGDD